MKKLLTAGVLALACYSAQAQEPLTDRQELLQKVVITTLVLDYAQTMDIKRHAGIYEKNPILGKHPSDLKITGYFIASIALSNYAVKHIPMQYREAAQVALIAIEIATILQNKKIGLNFRF